MTGILNQAAGSAAYLIDNVERMTVLGNLEPWEAFKLKLHTYRVIFQPLCRHSSLSASALCLNLDTNCMETIKTRTKVRRIQDVSRENQLIEISGSNESSIT